MLFVEIGRESKESGCIARGRQNRFLLDIVSLEPRVQYILIANLFCLCCVALCLESLKFECIAKRKAQCAYIFLSKYICVAQKIVCKVCKHFHLYFAKDTEAVLNSFQD